MCCGLKPCRKEDACIGGQGLYRYGATILVAHQAAEARPQRGVALWLHPSLLNDCCQLIIFLQCHASQARQEDKEEYHKVTKC